MPAHNAAPPRATATLASNEKGDRRTRRTRRHLCEAMLALLVERDYESITIQEITSRADVNRATFYHHFERKEELLAAALENQFDDLVASFGDLPGGKLVWHDRTPETLTFRHVAEHAALYKVLLSDRGLSSVIYRIINYIARHAQNKLPPPVAGSEIPLPIIAQHMAGSLFALLSWWLEHEMPYSPEIMAEMSHTLCTQGVSALLEGGENATP